MTERPETGTIEQIRTIKKISDQMDDANVDEALRLVVELIKKPDVNSADVSKAITKLSALAAYFATEASYYKGWGKAGIEERYKKDMYYTLKDSLNHLADAVKYQAKAGQGGFNQ